MYDDVLRLRHPKSAQIVGFEEDIALMIRDKHLDELVRTCNTAVGMVRSWIAEMALKLAEHNTVLLLISSRKRMEFITITLGDQHITANRASKYLGVMIDNKLAFKELLTYIGGKCAATSCALV